MEENNKKRRRDHSSTRNDDDDDGKPENMPISFSNKDFTFKGTNAPLPMVIKLQINNFSILRVFINTGSQANILYISPFLKMRLSESMLQPCDAFLEDIIGNGVPVKRYIDLNTTFGKGGNAKMIKVRYLVVDSQSIYNVVIGMPTLSDLGVMFSPACLTMKYPLGDGKVRVVRADLEIAKKCYEKRPCTI